MAPIATHLGLLTLAGSALAAGHSGYRHSRYHAASGRPLHQYQPSGAPYGLYNDTGPYGANGTATGYPAPTSVSSSDLTGAETSSAYNHAPTPVGPATAIDTVTDIESASLQVVEKVAATCQANTVYETITAAVTVTVTASAPFNEVIPSSEAAAATTFSIPAVSASSASRNLTYSAVQKHAVHTWGQEAHQYGHFSASSAAVSTIAAESTTSFTVAEVTTASPVVESTNAATTFAASPLTPASQAATVETEAATAEVSATSTKAALSAYSSASSSVAASTASTPSTVAASCGYVASTNKVVEGKRGCAYNDASYCSHLTGNAMTWGYNWAQTTNSELPTGMTFIPQLWGTVQNGADITSQWYNNAKNAIDAGANVLLGFNEPDEGAQAYLTPKQAAAAWGNMTQFQDKAKIASPGVTSNSDPSCGLGWLSAFQKELSNEEMWDITQVHYYQDCTNLQLDSTSYFNTFMKSASTTFGKPVWVTEIGCNDGASDEQMIQFYNYATSQMDGMDFIQKYSWAMAADTSTIFPSALFTGGSLNAFGTAYQAAPNCSTTY